MNQEAFSNFWTQETKSGHPTTDDAFFEKMAEEHALFLNPADRNGPIIDFACGAGELLSHFARFADVSAGLDFSSSMLAQARQRMGDLPVELIEGNGFLYGKEASQPVWTTCQGMNQYLAPDELIAWIGTFIANPGARSLYLFDCVDPLRYKSLSTKSSYTTRAPSPLLNLRRSARYVKLTARNLSHGEWADLGSTAMGYGYTPQFIRKHFQRDGLALEFGSSRLYEYRFHVALRKSPQHATSFTTFG